MRSVWRIAVVLLFVLLGAGIISSSGGLTHEQPADDLSPATYCSSTNGMIATGQLLGTVTSIAYLWHPAADTKRYQIRIASYSGVGGAGTGRYMLHIAYISAENVTPGGTAQPIYPIDGAPASGATFRTGATGAPTREAGDVRTYAFAATAPAIESFSPAEGMQPFTLLPSVARGIEVRSEIVAALSQDAYITFFVCWTEQ